MRNDSFEAAQDWRADSGDRAPRLVSHGRWLSLRRCFYPGLRQPSKPSSAVLNHEDESLHFFDPVSGYVSTIPSISICCAQSQLTPLPFLLATPISATPLVTSGAR